MKRSLFILAILVSFVALMAPLPARADSEYDTALQSYYKGKYEETVSYLKEYVERKPDPAAYYLIGYSLYELGRFSEATQYFDQAYLIDPNFSPEKSGLSEKFPKGKWEGVKKHAVRKGKPALKKKRKTAVTATKQVAKQEAGKEKLQVPAGKQQPKEPQTKKVGKPAADAGAQKAAAGAQKTATPTPGVQNKKPEPAKVTPQEKTAAPSQKVAPQEERPPVVLPPHPLTQKDVKTLVPIVAVPMVMGGLLAGFTFVFLVVGLAAYLYFSLCLFMIAKKLDVPSPWTAWIPLVQLWTFVTCGGKPWWWILLLLIPILNVIIIVYLWMCISENLGRNKWLGLLWLLPVINLVFIGYLAFSKTVGQDTGFVADTPQSMSSVEHEEEF